MTYPYKKRRLWPYVLVAVLILLVGAGYAVYRSLDNITSYVFEETDMGKHLVEEVIHGAQFGGESDVAALLPRLLAFDEPRTYLVLFQNNTELRPSGGFIGVYAVLRFDKGKMDILKLEGTEILDWGTPDSWKPVPPQPITDHLGVDRWYFRDSNWSPDFPTAAQKALELYIGEEGAYASEIDTVVAITPTVFERLLELTGPVTVEGKIFTADNAVETLEYEVEYAYADSGRTVEQRKDIIVPLVRAVIQRATIDGFLHPEKYLNTFQALFEEKHILAYSLDESLNTAFQEAVWTGRVVTTTGDYLMWVDANLGALKTDHAIERLLFYQVYRGDDGKYYGSVTMTYRHTGTFDWRTTRYQTYARVFVPQGSRLVETMHFKGFEDHAFPEADHGVELGHTWFGTYVRIEPGRSEGLTFTYELPAYIGESIERGNYDLLVQKQPGTLNPALTLTLDFDKTVTAANPAESEKHWGDDAYVYDTRLDVDRKFHIGL